jgi:hypothetical protein
MSSKIQIYASFFFTTIFLIIAIFLFQLNKYDIYTSSCNKDFSISAFKKSLFENVKLLTYNVDAKYVNYNSKNLNKIIIDEKNAEYFLNQVVNAVTAHEKKKFISFRSGFFLSNSSNVACPYHFMIDKNLETPNSVIANNLKKYVFFIVTEENINYNYKAYFSEIKFYDEYLVLKNNFYQSEIIYFSELLKKNNLAENSYIFLKRDFFIIINVILFVNFLVFCIHKLISSKKK